MKKISLFVFFCALLLSSSPLYAQAVVIGQPCTSLGTTTMATNEKNIASCLKTDTGALVWKAMNGGFWESVAVTDTASFDVQCSYRFYQPSSQHGPLMWYPIYIGRDGALLYAGGGTSGTSVEQFVRSTNKFRTVGGKVFTSVEKLCP